MFNVLKSFNNLKYIKTKSFLKNYIFIIIIDYYKYLFFKKYLKIYKYQIFLKFYKYYKKKMYLNKLLILIIFITGLLANNPETIVVKKDLKDQFVQINGL